MLCSLPRIPEPAELAELLPPIAQNTIVHFEGEKQMFLNLRGWNSFLLAELRRITRKRWLKVADAVPEVSIGINIRRGKDFRDAQSPQDFIYKGALRTPLNWFAESVMAIRSIVGDDVPAVVVSDGTPQDLQEVLTLKNIVFHRPGCAISDLLALSRTRFLLGSGGSSFSAWAAFLGRIPVVTHPGQSLNWFKLAEPNGPCVAEFDPRSPSKEFAASVIDAFQAKATIPMGHR